GEDVGVRPLVGPVLALGLGTVLGTWVATWPEVLAGLSACMALLAVVRRGRPGGRACVLAASLLTGSTLAVRAAAADSLPPGGPVVLEGRLASVEVDARGARGTLDVHRADGAPVRARTRLWWNAPERRPWPGDEVRLVAELRADVGAESWGEFDRGKAARARGQSTAGRVLPGTEVPLSAAPGWQRWLGQRREAFAARAQASVADPDAATLL